MLMPLGDDNTFAMDSTIPTLGASGGAMVFEP